MPVRTRDTIPKCPGCDSTNVGCIYRSIDSDLECQDCGLYIERAYWNTLWDAHRAAESERPASRPRIDPDLTEDEEPAIPTGIPVTVAESAAIVQAPAAVLPAPRPLRNGFDVVNHMGERVVFVPNLNLQVTRVPDAVDFYKSAIAPLKNKFAMELITGSWTLAVGSCVTKSKPAKIQWSAIGQTWKDQIQELDFWREIPIHLVAEIQKSALEIATQRGFCSGFVDWDN